MANTTVLTVRIERALLDDLKHAARAEGRSTSGHVVHLLKKELRPLAQAQVRPYRLAEGALAHIDVAETVEEFRLGPWIEAVVARRARRHEGRKRP